jgi:hypothetical protein
MEIDPPLSAELPDFSEISPDFPEPSLSPVDIIIEPDSVNELLVETKTEPLDEVAEEPELMETEPPTPLESPASNTIDPPLEDLRAVKEPEPAFKLIDPPLPSPEALPPEISTGPPLAEDIP